jgi:hypothetical protein
VISDGTMIAGQVRYQLTLLVRNPRTLMAGLHLTAGAIGGHGTHVWPGAGNPVRSA